ncbi:MAG: DUF1330 domain-containing protein [Boseongicola sp.]|nr:MAG: DUF1330 domain-containing protein [Boseongicola sp.]
MAKGYWILHVTVNNAEAYKEYVEKDTPIIEGLGGRFLVRGGQCEVPEGDTFDRHVVIEFPSYEQAKIAYNDSRYQEVADIRKRNAESVAIVVEGT